MKTGRGSETKVLAKAARMLIAVCLCVVMLPFGVWADDGPAQTGQGADGAYEQGQTAGQEGQQGQMSGQEGQQGSPDGSGAGGGSQGDGTEAADNGDGRPQTGQPAAGGAGEASDAGEAADGTEASADTAGEDAPVESRKARTFTWGGTKVSLKSDVLIDEPLGESARTVRVSVTGQKGSMKVFWTKAPDADSLDGYIVLRSSNGIYKEIARVSSGTTSYTDKKASSRNTGYYYTVVGYVREGSDIKISYCSQWAAGVTTGSKKINAYTATLNRTSATMQVGETMKLSLKFASPSKTYASGTVRWKSAAPGTATVDAKGNVTATGEGAVSVRARIPSGRDISCTVTVVGAYKPGTPAAEVEYATEDSIWLTWNKNSHATSYDVYRSDDGGATFGAPVNVTGTAYTDEGLEAEHEYTYYIQARNDNHGYTALSDKSAEIVQKAVKTPRRTKMHGLRAKASPKAGTAHKISFSVYAPDGRRANLQELQDGSWKTVAGVTLPAGAGEVTSSIEFPNTWWNKKSTSWRFYIPASEDATEYISPTLTVTPSRRYQNPKGYVQITNTISKHGYSYYTSPVLVNNMSTKSDHIEAMIKTAYKYKGDKYANRWSRAPGKGVDCSGLVMQACYGAGVDLWPSNPHRHRYGAAKYEWESREIAKMKTLRTVPYKDRKRGDLIFFCNSKGVVIHVAIYLGNNQIIHSTTVGGRVKVSGMGGGAYGRVCKVKRIFN